MSSTVPTITGNRFVRRGVLAVGAILITFGLSACGGSDDPGATSPDFRAYCQKTKECIGDADFERFHGTIEQCAGSLAESFNTQDKSCKEASAKAYRCYIENFSCTQGAVQSPQECQDEDDKVDSACQ